MKKIYILLLIAVFSLMICGSALADADLVEWGNNPTSSDSNSSGTGIDRMDTGNTNEPGNWGSTEVQRDMINGKTLEVTINNGYPGYQSYIDDTIVNDSGSAVSVTGVSVTGDPSILVELKNMNGTPTTFSDTVPFDIAKGGIVPVRLIVRVRQVAAQNNTYTAKVVIDVQQDSKGGDDDDDDDIIGDDDDDDTTPPEPVTLSQPPVKEPIKLPVELPYTGANVALFTGTGLALGGFGLVIRRKK
ncbi:MAG TPA: LPXTG cell wall anchor domain-containing protein [Syntrophomonadaceae bacterium]|nr:LPXTG cell wall anchor domain-containing protein [Syntrophomonadaceae bacterium]